MTDQDRDSSPAMGVANMLAVHVLPFLVQVEDADTRKRLMELYDSMQRVALRDHYSQRAGGQR
jgi:hypothetical protein